MHFRFEIFVQRLLLRGLVEKTEKLKAAACTFINRKVKDSSLYFYLIWRVNTRELEDYEIVIYTYI